MRKPHATILLATVMALALTMGIAGCEGDNDELPPPEQPGGWPQEPAEPDNQYEQERAPIQEQDDDATPAPWQGNN